VAVELAALIGCPRALLLPSTLHLFMDLFEVLAAEPIAIHLDCEAYPIAHWAAERIAARGVPVQLFPHHDPDGLNRSLRQRGNRRPVVVVDGYCPLCGAAAPLCHYSAIVRRHDGLLVVDDTQALGVLGNQLDPRNPYGTGGGGSLRWGNLQGPDIVVGASLAKGFGVPVAVLAGSESLIERFAAGSATRVHCSPPAAPVIHAAESALDINRRCGDALRLRLADRVRRFRRGLSRIGLQTQGGWFPVQSLDSVRGLDPLSLHGLLWRRGIRSVPLARRRRGGSRLGFLLTADQTDADIDRCLAALAEITAARPIQQLTGHAPQTERWKAPARALCAT
jgi:8-amino-7-oxononanoate synthase